MVASAQRADEKSSRCARAAKVNHEGSFSRIWFLSTSSILDDGETKDIWSYLTSKHDTFLWSPIPLQNDLTSPSLPKLGKELGTVDYQSILKSTGCADAKFLAMLVHRRSSQFRLSRFSIMSSWIMKLTNFETEGQMAGRVATAGYYPWVWATPKKNKDRSSIYVKDQQNHKPLKFKTM